MTQEKPKIITTCECGSTTFYIFENLIHTAYLDEAGNLQAGDNTEAECADIHCKECGKIYQSGDFNNIYF